MQVHAAGRFLGTPAGNLLFIVIQPEAILTAFGNAGADKNFQLFRVHQSVFFNLSQQRFDVHVIFP